MLDFITQISGQLVGYVKDMLINNQIAGGGFVIVLMGAMSTYIYKTWAPFKKWIRRRFVITIDVQSSTVITVKEAVFLS